MREITTPITKSVLSSLSVGDSILISGYIITGRDAVLPKLVKLIESGKISEIGFDLRGSVIFHTAVSPAGVGPTSSNKLDIESSIPSLSKAGVAIHLGKGALSQFTIEKLNDNMSLYATIPPVTSLLLSKTLEKKVLAFPEEGMEALHLLKVDKYPAIIAIAHGDSIYQEE